MELLKALLETQSGSGNYTVIGGSGLNLVHAAFEAANGANTIVSCAEAECEAVRISVMGVLSTVIALRRRMDPGLYGSELGAPAPSSQAAGAPSAVVAPTLSVASVQQAKDRQTRLLQASVPPPPHTHTHTLTHTPPPPPHTHTDHLRAHCGI
jgi:hypothetical protein